MSERELKICRCTDRRVGWGEDTYKPATGAPSVSAVVEAMKMAREDAQGIRYWEKHYGNPANAAAACQRRDRLDSLIARLEGA